MQYERVALLKQQRPNLIIELNGGLNKPEDCIKALEKFDGVMVGRAAYSHPMRWIFIDELIFGEKSQTTKPSKIILEIIPYTENHLNKNGLPNIHQIYTKRKNSKMILETPNSCQHLYTTKIYLLQKNQEI